MANDFGTRLLTLPDFCDQEIKGDNYHGAQLLLPLCFQSQRKVSYVSRPKVNDNHGGTERFFVLVTTLSNCPLFFYGKAA